jgi:uncharacterized protein
LLCCQNLTREVLLADKVRKADHYFSRLLGLLPKHQLESGEGLWIIPCNDIHSIGMRFTFDALFLDKDLKVVHLIEHMKPLRLSPIIKNAKTVLELDSGVISQTGTQLGDQLRFEPTP